MDILNVYWLLDIILRATWIGLGNARAVDNALIAARKIVASLEALNLED